MKLRWVLYTSIMTGKELTPRQIREREAYEAERITEEQVRDQGTTIVKEIKLKPRMTAADRRDFYRKQAGWPPLRT